jgi:hypothetical protein
MTLLQQSHASVLVFFFNFFLLLFLSSTEIFYLLVWRYNLTVIVNKLESPPLN